MDKYFVIGQKNEQFWLTHQIRFVIVFKTKKIAEEITRIISVIWTESFYWMTVNHPLYGSELKCAVFNGRNSYKSACSISPIDILFSAFDHIKVHNRTREWSADFFDFLNVLERDPCTGSFNIEHP